ncbi:MAG: choice-of-anchor E domain-containing protein [Chthoniobacteraceae bacterium]
MTFSLLRKCARLGSLVSRNNTPEPPVPALVTSTATAVRETADTYSFCLQSFDSLLGTLEKITFTLSASIKATFSFDNPSRHLAEVSFHNKITLHLHSDGTAIAMNGKTSFMVKTKVAAGEKYNSGEKIRVVPFDSTEYSQPEILALFAAEGGGETDLTLISNCAKSFQSKGGFGIYNHHMELDATLDVAYVYSPFADAALKQSPRR